MEKKYYYEGITETQHKIIGLDSRREIFVLPRFCGFTEAMMRKALQHVSNPLTSVKVLYIMGYFSSMIDLLDRFKKDFGCVIKKSDYHNGRYVHLTNIEKEATSEEDERLMVLDEFNFDAVVRFRPDIIIIDNADWVDNLDRKSGHYFTDEIYYDDASLLRYTTVWIGSVKNIDTCENSIFKTVMEELVPKGEFNKTTIPFTDDNVAKLTYDEYLVYFNEDGTNRKTKLTEKIQKIGESDMLIYEIISNICTELNDLKKIINKN